MCDCIPLMNKALAEHNAEINAILCFGRETNRIEGPYAQIERIKLDTKKRKPLPALIAEYCPFCGDRYEWPDPTELTDEQLTAELERAARQRPLLEEKGREFHWERSKRDRRKEAESMNAEPV